jgi:hypothetical protein
MHLSFASRSAGSSKSVDQVAHTFAVYAALAGSVTEAARRFMQSAEATEGWSNA